MQLFRLISRESRSSIQKIVAVAMLSGLANAMVLAVINAAAASPHDVRSNFRYLLLFAITITTYIVAQRYILVRSAEIVEGVLDGIRNRLVDLLRVADLLPIEKIGRTEIFSAISKDIVAVSQATVTMVTVCQSSLLIFFSLIYLAVLSFKAFLITVFVSALGISVHFARSRLMERDMHESINRENRFLDLLTQLLDGFKEAKINFRLGNALNNRLQTASASLEKIKIQVSRQFSSHYIFSQAVFYVMIACVVFLLPRLNEPHPEILTKATATILFVIGPLTNVIGSIPLVSMANVAVANVEAIEKQLSSAVEIMDGDLPPPTAVTEFREIRLDRLVFEYTDPAGLPVFQVGPLDLAIHPGEIVFVVGGNGAGKSTFLKLLTALYYPRSGRLLLDGEPVTASSLQTYRNLFGVIFTDYHLFDQLYGLEIPEPVTVEGLLERFDLAGKVALDGMRWSTTALSTGQRKRLALIVNLLYDKPIQVFDEWAADQDPNFRRYFYEVLLPQMKRDGRTVIAATHDDRYFHVADRVLRMEFGSLLPLDNERTSPTI